MAEFIEIKARLLPSKAISLSKNIFGNKMENSVTKIVFSEIEENANLLNKYVMVLTPEDKSYLIPLDPEDNSFIVTLDITRIDGVYTMLFLSTNSQYNEETGELLDPNFKTYVSNPTTFKINYNFLSEENLQEPECDPNLLNLFESMNQTVIYLNSEEFKQTLIDSLHLSEEDIQTITNNLKNDEEFKEALKGEDGEPGKSSYQEWLDLGNQGTEEDFINSLKGKDGESCYYEGEEPPTDTSKLWIVEEEDSNEEIVLSTTINKIEVVNEYPETRDPKTLYVLVEE